MSTHKGNEFHLYQTLDKNIQHQLEQFLQFDYKQNHRRDFKTPKSSLNIRSTKFPFLMEGLSFILYNFPEGITMQSLFRNTRTLECSFFRYFLQIFKKSMNYENRVVSFLLNNPFRDTFPMSKNTILKDTHLLPQQPLVSFVYELI